MLWYIGTGVLSTGADGQCMYEVESLIIPPVCGGGGAPYTPHNDAQDMSETGVVVGWYEACGFTGQIHPFMWSEATGFVQLQRPAGYTSIEATGISPNGRYIVGWGGKTGLSQVWSILWDNGVPTEIPPTGASRAIHAQDVNDSGLIVGHMEDPDPGSDQFVPFRLVDGKVEVLESSYARQGWAVAVYNDGTIAGRMGSPLFGAVGAIWRDDSVTLLFGSPDAASTSISSVNMHGVAAGGETVPKENGSGWDSYAAIWRGQTFLSLEREQCDAEWIVWIADSGQMVGECHSSSEPVLWNNLQPFKLEDLIVYPELIRVYEPVKVLNDGRILLVVDVDPKEFQVLGATAILTPIASPPSDINHDCITDSNDLLLLLEQWNQTESYADVDGNGIVNVFDLLELLVNWG